MCTLARKGVQQWWQWLREGIGESKDTLGGFYTLRHLGATEFGSRRGCSLIAMKQWLGHSASSSMADRYMKPVAPEHRKLIEWVRKRLRTATRMDRAGVTAISDSADTTL